MSEDGRDIRERLRLRLQRRACEQSGYAFARAAAYRLLANASRTDKIGAESSYGLVPVRGQQR